jgi:hypothetical protein
MFNQLIIKELQNKRVHKKAEKAKNTEGLHLLNSKQSQRKKQRKYKTKRRIVALK